MQAEHTRASLAAAGIKHGHVALLLRALPHAAQDAAEALEVPSFDFGSTRPACVGPLALVFPEDMDVPIFDFSTGVSVPCRTLSRPGTCNRLPCGRLST